MTEKQYRDYAKLKKEIEPLEDFLFWCGDKYHGAVVGNYPIRLIKKRFYIGRKGRGAVEDDIFEIPETLKYQIIKTIENYVAEKRKELDEI